MHTLWEDGRIVLCGKEEDLKRGRDHSTLCYGGVSIAHGVMSSLVVGLGMKETNNRAEGQAKGCS